MGAFGKTSLKNLEGIHPDLVEVMKEAVKDSPVDFTVFSGVRTLAEQKGLYALGRTKVNADGKSKSKPMGNIVTKADGVKNKSNHQVKTDGFGHAVDIYPYYNGQVHFNDEHSLELIAVHVKAIAKCLGKSITWGGDWHSIVDKPHFEV